jgi:hypothetical protein
MTVMARWENGHTTQRGADGRVISFVLSGACDWIFSSYHEIEFFTSSQLLILNFGRKKAKTTISSKF